MNEDEDVSLQMAIQLAIRDMLCEQGLTVRDWQLQEVLSFGCLTFKNVATGEVKTFGLKVTE